ncbi:MAG: carbohydrate kinase family protein [Anaerolineaceae bacterium]|nr:carbohydrate kinase family protein [Anaerolineaceae bacterium]
MKAFDVIGLGVSTVDILSLVNNFPSHEGVQSAHNMLAQGGGPVATAIVTLARLGARTAMIDTVGDDWRAQIILDEFRQGGICTEHVLQRDKFTSSTASITVRSADGARSIVYYPGTAGDLNPDDLPRAAIETARFLHVNGRHWDACLQAADWARSAGVRVSFDGGANRYRDELRKLVPLTHICIVAREFAESYTRETHVETAASRLLDEGPELVVITEGIKGSWIFPQDGKPFHQPAYLFPKVVDTTGCGDSYHGAFLFALCREMSYKEGAKLASAVAALNSQHLGGRTGLPTLKQVEAFLAQHPSPDG